MWAVLSAPMWCWAQGNLGVPADGRGGCRSSPLTVPTRGGVGETGRQLQGLSSGTPRLLTPGSSLFALLPSFAGHGHCSWSLGRGRGTVQQSCPAHFQSAASAPSCSELNVPLHLPGGQTRGEGKGDRKYQRETSLCQAHGRQNRSVITVSVGSGARQLGSNPALPPANCAKLGKLPHLSGPWFPLPQVGTRTVSARVGGNEVVHTGLAGNLMSSRLFPSEGLPSSHEHTACSGFGSWLSSHTTPKPQEGSCFVGFLAGLGVTIT